MPEVWTPPAFDDIATSETVTAAYLNQLGNSLRFLKRVGQTTFTSDVSVTATTEATAQQVASLGAITYEAVPHLLEFFSESMRPDAGAAGRTIKLVLRDSTTVIGRLGAMITPAAANMFAPVYVCYEFTPTAASHTYNVATWVSAGTGQINAGTGGADDSLQGLLRITRVPT